MARVLAPSVRQCLRGTYIEPFLGAGAMFLSVLPRKALLGDINGDLVIAWQSVVRSPGAVASRLRRMPVNKKSYYKVRAAEPPTPIGMAARFIYLNATCYGGLHRTNRHGRFNVPYGGGDRAPKGLLERGTMLEVSRACRPLDAEFREADFEEVLETAQRGDVCYLDPTFSTRSHRDAGLFDRYNPAPYSWNDQQRLAGVAEAAAKRGAMIVISNAYSRDIAGLFHGADLCAVARHTGFGRSNGGPTVAREYVIMMAPRRVVCTWREALSPIAL